MPTRLQKPESFIEQSNLLNTLKITYKDAGVDLAKVKTAHKTIENLISHTHSFKAGTLSGYGHYAGLIEIGNNKVIAMHTDGVGTKVIIAQMAGRFDTVGIDCIAMNVNDIICVGAEPIAFVDYIALKKANERLVQEIVKGLVEGARQADVAIIGGETAVMPGVITGHEQAFDLAGTVIGMTDKDKLVLGDKISEGDVIIGVESNGLHSNGYSLVRKVLLGRYKIKQKISELHTTLASELLRPTRIYVKPVLEVLRSIEVHGLAHITGGAFTKLTRLTNKVGFELDNMPEPQEIFKLIKKHAKVNDREMYSTFNMGIGFCIIVPRGHEDAITHVFRRHDMRSSVIGRISDKKGVYIGKLRIA
ncbi:MAG: phosphoribosylformylglycinamidine cyclo-ligase [Candidatus Nitrosomirales archaeon]